MNRQPWTNKEDQAIQKLIKTYGIQDWTKVANKLKDEGWIPQRTGKQCRQRWYNHLNPSVNKNPWSPYEEKRLFKLHRQYGNRWKEIAQNFIGRTDNDIKNHFYSTLRRSLRRLNKILGQKNSTSQMREIKPSVLSTIMNEIYERDKGIETVNKSFLSTLKDLPFLIFEFTNLKPIKGNIKETKIQEVKEKISNIFELINKFNAQYQSNKMKKRGKDNKIKEIENSTGSSEYKMQNQSEVLLETKKKVGIYPNQIIEQPDIQKEQQSHLKANFGGQKVEDIMKPQQSTLLKQQQFSILDEEQQNLQKHKISLDEDYELNHFDDLSQPSLIGYSQDNPFDNLIIVGKHLQVPKITCPFAEEFVEEVLEMNYDDQ